MRIAGAILLAINACVAVFSVAGTWALGRGSAPELDYIGLSKALGLASILTAAACATLLMAAGQGLRRTVLLLAVAGGIATAAELAGVTWGLPFGSYEYTDRLGPRLLGAVPAVIPLAWFTMSYASLHACFLLRLRPALVVLCTGLLLTAWDLALDPAMTADNPAWVWDGGGAYYGIPLMNFVGWFATGCSIAAAHVAAGEGWVPDRSRLPMVLYLVQGCFAAVLAALYGRGLAAVAFAAALMGIAALVWAVVRNRRPAHRDDEPSSGEGAVPCS